MNAATNTYIATLKRWAREATRAAGTSVRARLAGEWARNEEGRRHAFERRWRRTAVWMWTKEGAARETRRALIAALEEGTAQWLTQENEAWGRTVFLAGVGNAPITQAGTAAHAVCEAWVEALGGEAALEGVLARFAAHKGVAPAVPSAGRIETLAKMDERGWRALERGPAWARAAAVRRLEPEIIAKGPRAWVEALARSALTALVGRERRGAAPGGACLERALAHWRWAEACPPLGMVALCAHHKPLRTDSAWGGAVRLEAHPRHVRECIALRGRAGASATLRGEVECEQDAIDGEVQALAERWRSRSARREAGRVRCAGRLVHDAESDQMAWEVGLDNPDARDAAEELAAASGLHRAGDDAAWVIRVPASRDGAVTLAARSGP